MVLSDAHSAEIASPRSRASASRRRMMAVSTPRRRWVGRVAMAVTPPKGRTVPPGTVMPKVRAPPVPTISSPSKAPR